MVPDLSIIIVNWRSKDYVRGCLTTVYRDLRSASYEVLVVDNASFDGVAEMLAAEFPQVCFIQSAENLGFAGANNLAFHRSRGRNIMFLNPDTELQGDALQELLAALDTEPKAGMVGARLLNSNLTLQTSCVAAIPTLLNQLMDSAFLRRALPDCQMWGMRALWTSGIARAQVEAISGACMVARRSLLESLGVFSTDYFMYVEDMDLCLRTTRAGWNIYYVPTATIVHHGGGSSARRESSFSNVVLRASLWRFFQIHRGQLYALCYRLCLVLASALRMLLIAISLPVVSARCGFGTAVQPLTKWWSIFVWSAGLVAPRLSRTRADASAASGTALRPA